MITVQPIVIPSMSVGGRVFTDLANLIILYGKTGGTNTHATLRKQGGSSGYQVTSGKTLTISAVRTITTGTGGVFSATLAYGDTDVGFNAASDPTNVKYIAQNSTDIVWIANFVIAGSSANSQDYSAVCDFQIPSLKFPSITCIGVSQTVVAFGYEA